MKILGSGSFVPALKNRYTYLFSSIISFITRNNYPFIFVNLINAIKSKEKKQFLWVVIIIILPIVTRSQRIIVLIALCQTYFLYNFLNRSPKLDRLIKFFGIILIIIMGYYTEYRMNAYGVYDISYSETIQYVGPIKNKLFVVFYGYFPLSFDNLNRSIILNGINTFNTFGLITFKFLFFGLFQFDNIFDVDPYIFDKTINYVVGSATVPTQYYDFIMDFGYFCFIPISIAMFITHNFYKLLVNKRNILGLILYFYFAPLWILSSFQNILFSSIMIWGIILSLIFYKSFIKRLS